MKRNFKQQSVKKYEESVSALKDSKSITSHSTRLGKIINRTEGAQLQKLLEEVMIELQLK